MGRMFLDGRGSLRDYLLSLFCENRFSDYLSTDTHLRPDTTRRDSRFLSSVRNRSLCCYSLVCSRRRLTVTSRKAHAGTLVPFGIVFENLRANHQDLKEEPKSGLKTNVDGGSTAVQLTDHVFHLYQNITIRPPMIAANVNIG